MAQHLGDHPQQAMRHPHPDAVLEVFRRRHPQLVVRDGDSEHLGGDARGPVHHASCYATCKERPGQMQACSSSSRRFSNVSWAEPACGTHGEEQQLAEEAVLEGAGRLCMVHAPCRGGGEAARSASSGVAGTRLRMTTGPPPPAAPRVTPAAQASMSPSAFPTVRPLAALGGCSASRTKSPKTVRPRQACCPAD